MLGNDLKNGIYGLSVVKLDGPGCCPYVSSSVDNITGDPANWW